MYKTIRLENEMVIGIDVSDKHSYLCGLDQQSNIVFQQTIPTKMTSFQKFFTTHYRLNIALEAGTHSLWMSQMLTKLGHKVTVANPRQLALIYKSNKKNDKQDAVNLAKLLRLDPQLLYPVTHKSEQIQQDLTVLRTRDKFVQMRTQLINHVRSQVKQFGIRLPKCSSASFGNNQEIRTVVPKALLCSLDLINEFSQRIKAYDQEVEHISQTRYPQTQLLRQIHGVGPLTALLFVLSVGEIARFKKSRDVGSYFGLVPRQDQSGTKDLQLGISKAGNPMMRRLLIQASHHILGPFGQESKLREFGLRLSERGGKKKAVVAVARKLSVLMHVLLVTGEEYDVQYKGK